MAHIKKHRWSNDPDTAHRKCIICGTRYDYVYNKATQKSDRVYTLPNGEKMVNEIPECIDPIDYNTL